MLAPKKSFGPPPPPIIKICVWGPWVWNRGLIHEYYKQCCQLFRIIRETPDFGPYNLPVSRVEYEISRLIAEVYRFL